MSERKSLQGVRNIIRFNWHFYLLALLVIIILMLLPAVIPNKYLVTVFRVTACLIALSLFISLAVSLYIYDLSGFYTLHWLEPEKLIPGQVIVNIHSGFDETSSMIRKQLRTDKLLMYDFYDPVRHTDVSIRRARKAYPAIAQTVRVSPGNLPLKEGEANMVLVILAAHEIRDPLERIGLFREIRRILAPGGRVVVVEHLRDLPNLLAFNIGFLHFFSRSEWVRTFREADLSIRSQKKINPFISVFNLSSNGISS